MSAKLITRRRFLKYLAGCACLGTCGIGYVRYVEPVWLKQVEHRLPLRPHGPLPPIRLVHLSDFHASEVVPFSLLERAVEVTAGLRPDLICITGDFVTREIPDRPRYLALLQRLVSTAPTLAVLGNHDGGYWAAAYGGYRTTREVEALLEEAAISCLMNRSIELEMNGRPVRVVGLGDAWARQIDPEKAFAGSRPSPGTPTIVLSHNPDTKQHLEAYDWDLLLSGHTHGGQFSLPIVGTPFAPVRDHRYVHGLRPWRDRWIHVTSGVGNLHGVRLHCRPEVCSLLIGT